MQTEGIYYPAEDELEIFIDPKCNCVFMRSEREGHTDTSLIRLSLFRLPDVIEYLKQCLMELRNKPQPET